MATHPILRLPVAGRPRFACLMLFFVLGCSGGDGGPVTPNDPGPGDPGGGGEAPPPVLSTGQADPLEPIFLTGLPDGRLDLVADLSAQGASQAAVEGDLLLPLVPVSGGRYELRIPIHPTTITEGGAVDLRVRGPGLITLPVQLTLAPLPPAPGAFAARVESLQAQLDAEMLAAGITRDALLSAHRSGTLEPGLVPLALAQTLLDDPAHGNDLGDLLRGDPAFASLLGSGPVSLDLLDRLSAAAVRSVTTSTAPSRPSAPTAPVHSGAPGAVAGFRPARLPIDIDSAETLDLLMSEAWAARRGLDPDTPTGELLEAYGWAAGALGLKAGSLGPVAGGAVIGAAVFVLAYQTYLEGKSKVYPIEFVPGSLTFDIDIPVFKEDQDGPGNYSNVLVSARSEGWNLDRNIANWTSALWGALSTGTTAFNAWAKRVDADMFFADFLTMLLPQLVPDGSGALSIPPQTWSGIDVSEERWNRARVIGDAIRVETNRSYSPVRSGDALLVVETELSRFGDASPAFAHMDVRIDAISVSVVLDFPFTTRVEPGDAVPMTIIVDNAEDISLSWSTTDGELSPPEQSSSTTWEATLQTPELSDDFPVTVTFTSTATGGARSTAGAPVRRGTITFTAAEIEIDPEWVILAPEETQVFTATVTGLFNKEVSWTATAPDGGAAAISDNGQFTAPEMRGEYLIRATSVEDPSLDAVATAYVSDQCFWTLSLDQQRWSGSWAARTPVFMSFDNEAEAVGSPSFGNVFSPSGFSQGAHVGSFVFTPSDGPINWIAESSAIDEETSFSLVIEKNDGRLIQGYATGTARWNTGGDNDRFSPFSLRFRADLIGEDEVCG